MTIDELRAYVRDMHQPGSPLVMPKAWDVGSVRLFASLGFGPRYDELWVRGHARSPRRRRQPC